MLKIIITNEKNITIAAAQGTSEDIVNFMKRYIEVAEYGTGYTSEHIETMHNWLTENETILANVDDKIIIHAIDTHYPGGLKQFMLNNF